MSIPPILALLTVTETKTGPTSRQVDRRHELHSVCEKPTRIPLEVTPSQIPSVMLTQCSTSSHASLLAGNAARFGV
ncbi:hypothetical protein PM082_000166 [Marasmius tenuissimus]|nr:hypothetical protein PM082_000166 [Marasmius tenuissimus]